MELEKIRKLDEKYKSNNYNGIKNKGNNFKIIEGNKPIILSAPHAVKQIREGRTKDEDKLTGAIVEYLCTKTGANGIIRTWNNNDDPNYYNSGNSLEYKKAILNCIKNKNIAILIDVHGCKDNHGFDLEIGTNNGENINYNTNYLEILKTEFSKIGKVVIDEKFKSSKPTTVSSFINKNSGIPCIQIEIASNLRNRESGLIKLLEVFENVIQKII